MTTKPHIPIIPIDPNRDARKQAENLVTIWNCLNEAGVNYLSTIEDFRIPNIVDRYIVSDLGYIWDTYTNSILEEEEFDLDKGYVEIKLATYTKDLKVEYVAYPLNRVILSSFDYFDGCENVKIKHEDGNPLNNDFYNIFWDFSN